LATIRPARAEDASFLETMLIEAVNRDRERASISRTEALARRAAPTLSMSASATAA
jgi:hypothetical protein